MKSSVKAIAEDFIDSDKARTEAVKNGFKPDDSDNYMAFGHGLCPRDSKVSLCWKLKASGGGDRLYYAIDAKSGQFVGKSGY